ncbi:MAG: hypothetical protein LBC91_04930 [Candidatus Accumulibacter sp.]|nr:hypothetical protein [Accumulibacter sp.]
MFRVFGGTVFVFCRLLPATSPQGSNVGDEADFEREEEWMIEAILQRYMDENSRYLGKPWPRMWRTTWARVGSGLRSPICPRIR